MDGVLTDAAMLDAESLAAKLWSWIRWLLALLWALARRGALRLRPQEEPWQKGVTEAERWTLRRLCSARWVAAGRLDGQPVLRVGPVWLTARWGRAVRVGSIFCALAGLMVTRGCQGAALSTQDRLWEVRRG
ncbi:MAG: hypothetical protein CMH57_02540 [Myxococcales bacterium]|nr:hypothetical protein [Myxococcales bacterium]